MPALTIPHDTKPGPDANVTTCPPLALNTDEEVSAYLAAHLTPIRYGPKGQPIYAHEDIAKLNVRLYPDH